MSENELIIVPNGAKLKDAYIALLKAVYSEGKDYFWWDEIIGFVAAECGVGAETAADKCKQLVKFKLLQYVTSSLSGHRYQVFVYTKKGDEIAQIDSWITFDQLFKQQFGEEAETDLVKIRGFMTRYNASTEDSLRRSAAESFVNEMASARRITSGADDTIKSEFKTEKISTEYTARDFELKLKKQKNDSENLTILGE